MNLKSPIEVLSQPALKCAPPATDVQIKTLENRLQADLPIEIKSLLSYARSFDADKKGSVDLTGASLFDFCYANEILGNNVPICKTIEGNFWCVDVLSNGDWDAVWFVSHDPFVVLVQFEDISEFIEFCARKEDLVDNKLIVKSLRNQGTSVADALMSDDDLLSGFAKEVQDYTRVFDLRPGGNDIGFELKFESLCKRFGDHRMFALKESPKRSRSFLNSLLGKA